MLRELATFSPGNTVKMDACTPTRARPAARARLPNLFISLIIYKLHGSQLLINLFVFDLQQIIFKQIWMYFEETQEIEFQVDEEEPTNQLLHSSIPLVNIYLRKANKRSLRVTLPSETSLNQLFRAIERETDLKKDSFTVYLNGNKYEAKDQIKSGILIHLTLHENDIIHLHNKENIKKPQITINLQLYSPNRKKLLSKEFGVSSKQKIKTFIQAIKQSYEEFDKMKITLIESGRKLSEDKTFQQEDIEDQTALTIITDKDIYRLTEKKHKQQQVKQFEFNNGIMSFSEPSTPVSTIKRAYTWDQELTPLDTPNFKKKQKGIVMYKPSPKNNLSGIEPVWQSDSSGGSDANKKELLKFIQKRKAKQTEKSGLFLKKSIEKIEGEKFSMRDRLQLKQEVKKLFQSQSLGQGNSEIKRLQPPKIATDEFMEEIEEIQFYQQEEKIKKQSLEMKLPMDFGIDLRESIGKNKNRTTLQQLIPTRDFDTEQMQI